MPKSTKRRRLLGGLLGLPILLGTTALAYGFGVEPSWIEVTRHEIPAPVNERIVIAHLTDLHIRDLGARERRWLAALAEEKPDLIVITGDLVTPKTERSALHEILEQLNAPLGVFGVRGNWEIWTPASADPGYWGENALRLLHNERVSAGELEVVGFDDPTWGTLEPAPLDDLQDAVVVGLVHSPQGFDAVAGRVHLMLAGHTHGGQVRAPFWGALWLPPGSSPYVSGWYEKKESRLYVSRGLGTSMLDVRFLCRPELAFITLVPE